jgi:alanyl-tRNA synthetase
VRSLEEVTAKVEAQELLASETNEGRRVVTRIFENRDAESLRRLASALIEHEKTIALLGSREKESARLVFARSADESADMNQLMRDACATIDGRGGGKPDLAQGGGRNTDKLEVAIQQAAESLKAGA